MVIRGKNAFKKSEINRLKKYKKINEKEKFKVEQRIKQMVVMTSGKK